MTIETMSRKTLSQVEVWFTQGYDHYAVYTRLIELGYSEQQAKRYCTLASATVLSVSATPAQSLVREPTRQWRFFRRHWSGSFWVQICTAIHTWWETRRQHCLNMAHRKGL